MSPSLNRLVFLRKLSKSANALIWSNIAIGVLFILAGLLLSSLGVVHPVVAAIVHNLSALVILFNSARLVKMRTSSGA